MNDRYLFKAKTAEYKGCKGYGKWVVGCLLINEAAKDVFKYRIQPIVDSQLFAPPIDPTTLCQCTGLKDKNGTLIWENDIVFVTDDDGNSGQIDTGIGQIDFLEGLWYISGRVQNSLYDIDKCFQIEVIGSIFDNPELIEAEQ